MTTPVRAATAGAIGSIVALLLTFPVATVKVRLQAQRRNISASSSFSKIGTKPTSSNAIALISNIIKKEGFTKLYAGLLPALGKQAGTNFIFYFFFDILKRSYRSCSYKANGSRKWKWIFLHIVSYY